METRMIVGLVVVAIVVAGIAYLIYRRSVDKKLEEAAEEAAIETEKIIFSDEMLAKDEAVAKAIASKVSGAIKTVVKKRSHHKKK